MLCGASLVVPSSAGDVSCCDPSAVEGVSVEGGSRGRKSEGAKKADGFDDGFSVTALLPGDVSEAGVSSAMDIELVPRDCPNPDIDVLAWKQLWKETMNYDALNRPRSLFLATTGLA